MICAGGASRVTIEESFTLNPPIDTSIVTLTVSVPRRASSRWSSGERVRMIASCVARSDVLVPVEMTSPSTIMVTLTEQVSELPAQPRSTRIVPSGSTSSPASSTDSTEAAIGADGVTEPEALEAGLSPYALVATTLKV